MPKLSIIIPCYNSEKTILTTINSILSQDFPDFEILIINDGSTDNSEKVCRELKNPKIKVYTKENGRVVSSYIYGIKKAKGEYSMFCDSDDTFKPHVFKDVINTISKDSADMASFGYDLVTEDGKVLHTILNGYKNGIYNKADYKTHVLPNVIFNTSVKGSYYTLLVSRCCKVYKTSLLKSIIEFLNPKCYQMEDNIFTTLCVLNSSKIVISNKSIYNYITNSNTISKGFSPLLIDQYEYSFNHLQKLIKDYDIPNLPEQLTYMRFDFYRVIFRRACKALSFKKTMEILKTIRKLKITAHLKVSKIMALKNKVFYILERVHFDYPLYLLFRKF